MSLGSTTINAIVRDSCKSETKAGTLHDLDTKKVKVTSEETSYNDEDMKDD